MFSTIPEGKGRESGPNITERQDFGINCECRSDLGHRRPMNLPDAINYRNLADHFYSLHVHFYSCRRTNGDSFFQTSFYAEDWCHASLKRNRVDLSVYIPIQM